MIRAMNGLNPNGEPSHKIRGLSWGMFLCFVLPILFSTQVGAGLAAVSASSSDLIAAVNQLRAANGLPP